MSIAGIWHTEKNNLATQRNLFFSIFLDGNFPLFYKNALISLHVGAGELTDGFK